MTPQIKQRIEQIRRGEVPEGYKRTKAGVVPMEWEEVRIGDVLTQRKTLQCVSKDAPLLSFTIEEGVIDPADKKSNKRDFLIKDITTKKFALTEVGDIIYNPANLKFGAIHRNNLRRGVVSPIYGIFYGAQNSIFMGYLLHNQRFIDYAKIYAEGTVEKLKTLSADTYKKLKITLPSIEEQEKIAEILSTQDKLIALKEKLIEEKKRQKKALIKQILNDKSIRSRFSAHWDTVELKDVFDYIQPTKYLVESTDYSDDYETPVLTAGKSFILGYTNETHGIFDQVPVVIFDDFTTDSKYVDFPFKVKSSAMKILMIKEGFDIRFAYELLQNIDYIVGGHERHWISVFSQMTVDVPPYEVQQKIGQIIQCVNDEIDLLQKDLDQEKQKKKALMQLLLSGIVRV